MKQMGISCSGLIIVLTTITRKIEEIEGITMILSKTISAKTTMFAAWYQNAVKSNRGSWWNLSKNTTNDRVN